MNTNSNTTRTEADAVAEVVEKHITPTTLEVAALDGTKASIVAVPKGLELFSIKEFIDENRDRPERRQGTARFVDLDSFIAHANRFKDADSAIFANPNPTTPSLTSVLDYHRAGVEKDGARYGTHRGIYTFPLSEEWLVWIGRNKQAMSQVDFAEFIEGRILDIADGTDASGSAKTFAENIGAKFAGHAKLLQLSRGLTVRVDSVMQNATNLASGETQMVYKTAHNDENGAPLEVPGAFLVAIPVFKNGPLYRLPVRLRYRAREGKVTWWYEIFRSDLVFEHAFNEARDKATKDTALPVFTGTPE